jgi:hypothetical protein
LAWFAQICTNWRIEFGKEENQILFACEIKITAASQNSVAEQFAGRA